MYGDTEWTTGVQFAAEENDFYVSPEVTKLLAAAPRGTRFVVWGGMSCLYENIFILNDIMGAKQKRFILVGASLFLNTLLTT